MKTTHPTRDAEYLDKIIAEKKVTLMKYNLEVLRGLKKLSQAAQEEIASSSAIAGEVYQSFTDFKRRYLKLAQHTSKPLMESLES